MPEFLEFTVDKFTFRVATDRFYTPAGLWARFDAGQVWIGLSDFVQQRSGDVAFAEVKPPGALVKAGEEIAVIETIKVDTVLEAPAGGVVVMVNPALDAGPEVINLDPYGEGWLVVLEADDWGSAQESLLSPLDYFDLMKRQAEEEAART